MKIIDRYLLSSFIKNYLISLMALVGMYVALDMVFNFGNLTQARGHSVANLGMWRVMYDIADYYFYEAFFFYVQLSGVIAVVAAAFTLMRLSRFNETTALLAAGTPLLRVAASVIVAGIALNLVLLPVDQELIIPRMISKLARERGDVHEAADRTWAVRMLEDEYNGLFSAAMYWAPTASSPAKIRYFDVIERDADLRVSAHLYASAAVWNDSLKRWDLTDGLRVPIVSPDQPTPAVATALAAYSSDITPQEIALNENNDFIQFLSVARINQLLARPRSYGAMDLLKARHLRFTQPIVNVILLLLAVSMVLQREPGRLKAAAAKCMVLCGLCMGSVFLAQQLAGSPPGHTMLNFWPALMAWLPIFFFGPLSAYLLDRVKS